MSVDQGAQDWSLARSDSFAQRQWGSFLVDCKLTQQQVIDMDAAEFEKLVDSKCEDPVMREQFLGRRQDLWNQFFGFDTSGRRASVATSGMRGVEQGDGVEERGGESLSRRDSLLVLKGLWQDFLKDAGTSEQEALGLSDEQFAAKLREIRSEDPVLVARLSGHRQDLWNEYFGFETRKGSMTDMRVRNASVTNLHDRSDAP